MLENTTKIVLQLYNTSALATFALASLIFLCAVLRRFPFMLPFKKSFPVMVVSVKAACVIFAFAIGHALCFYLLTGHQFVDPGQWPFTLLNFMFFIIIGIQVADIIHVFLEKKYMETAEGAANTVSGLFRGVIYCSAILLALGAFSWQQGYSFTGVWVSTGLATALIGFALQQTLGDFFSGIALGVERSFQIGDWVILNDGTEGMIIDINWRATWLKDWDNTRHIIPNSKLAKQGFTNRGSEYSLYQPWYTIKLPAELDPRFAKELLLEGIYRCKYVLKNPAPVVRLIDASTVPYTYICWVSFPNYPTMFRGRDELYREIHYVLQQAGVFPASITNELRMRKSDIPVAEPPTIQLALKSQSIFSKLADDEIEKIAVVSHQKHYDTGATIQYEAGEIDALDIITSGVVEVFTELNNGKKISIGELRPGESYGLVSMFTDQPIPIQWVAQTDVTLIRIGFETMKELMLKYPDVADRIAVVVKQRQDEAEHLRLQNSSEPAPSSLREIKQYIRHIIRRGK